MFVNLRICQGEKQSRKLSIHMSHVMRQLFPYAGVGLLWLVVVLFAHSILVFLIFLACRGVDQGRKMAGRNS
jgi:hypothetical protein